MQLDLPDNLSLGFGSTDEKSDEELNAEPAAVQRSICGMVNADPNDSDRFEMHSLHR